MTLADLYYRCRHVNKGLEMWAMDVQIEINSSIDHIESVTITSNKITILYQDGSKLIKAGKA